MNFTILRHNFERFLREKKYFMIIILVTFSSLFATSYVVTMTASKQHIGVSQSAKELTRMDNENLSVTEVKKDKEYFKNIILGKYDAYVTKESGNYKVITTKKSDFSKALSDFLNEGKIIKSKSSQNKTIFKVILTVVSMTSMILSLILYKFYFDDRNGVDKRINLSGISTVSYTLQQFLFNFIVLFLINIIGLIILLPLLNIALSWQLIFTTFLIEIFASSFGMMLSTFTRKNQGALLIGTMLTVLTMLLSGALFTAKKGTLQGKIQYVFPQHYIAELGMHLDNINIKLYNTLSVIICYIILFMFIAIYCQMKRKELN